MIAAMKPSYIAWILLSLCLSGCAGLSAKLPDILETDLIQETVRQEQTLFQEKRRMQARLMPIADDILAANLGLCDKTGLDIGVITHTEKSYDKRLRVAARREAGAGEDPSILYIRPDSPGAAAGLMPGDVLIGPDGEPLASPGKNLNDALSKNAALSVRRADVTSPVTLAPEPRCAYPVKLKMSAAINAYANGKAIIVTSGMMDFVSNDAELAMVIGHELAHNELGHIRKIIGNLLMSGFATRYTRPFESEADYVGLYYAARADYDIDGVEVLWRRLAALSARPIVRAKTHPTFPDRYIRLQAAHAEIKAKKAKGLPLIPNMADTKNER